MKKAKAIGARSQGGVQSVEICARLLKTMAKLDGPQTLKSIGLASEMSPAKVHRYLASLIREGLVEQNPIDNLYDLGGASRQIGQSALQRLDVVRTGTPILIALHQLIGETVSLAVWGNEGATIIYSIPAQRPVSITVRPGTVFPILTSAVGKVCGAYMPRALTADTIERECVINAKLGLAAQFHEPDKVDAMLTSVRSKGFSLITGELMTGINAIGVPVIGRNETLTAAISSVGAAGSLDVRRTGKLLPALQAASKRFSEMLG